MDLMGPRDFKSVCLGYTLPPSATNRAETLTFTPHEIAERCTPFQEKWGRNGEPKWTLA